MTDDNIDVIGLNYIVDAASIIHRTGGGILHEPRLRTPSRQ